MKENQYIMTKKESRLLLTVLAPIFLIVTFYTIYYAQGYRLLFDSQTKQIKILQTGGAFFEIQPRGSKIVIDGKSQMKLSFIDKNAFIENLMPGTHNFLIEKEGYQSWEKNLEILKRQVTDAKYVLLFKNRYEFDDFSINDQDNVLDFYAIPTSNKIIIRLQNTSTTDWSLIAYNPENKSQDVVFTASSTIPFYNLEFIDENKAIAITNRYVALDLKDKKAKNYISENDAIMSLQDLSTTTKKTLGQALAHQIINNNIYYFAKDGLLYMADLSIKDPVALTKQPISVAWGQTTKLINLDKKLFLLAGSRLYFFDQIKGEFVLVHKTVKDIVLSPDKKKVAVNAGNEIYIYYLEEQAGQNDYKRGEKVFLDRYGLLANDIQWLNNNYLIANFGSQIKAIEIDNRDKINTALIAEISNSKFLFLSNVKKLLILSQGKPIISKDLIIP
jgi:hypothetical protein